VEKAIENPRHVEIQVLADHHGNVVHLFERDCSIQRRHQKVLEETPSPFSGATQERIAEMGAVAVRAAKAVGYHSAGTVEFLMAPTGEFYFLEMNTRLQVEHPITELITGMDLVREQVRIAAGEPLGYEQSDVSRRGHAIECRIYAEDPSHGFMPSPGVIDRLREPSGPGVRNDSCAYEGCRVERFYDPLISKLSVWAATREQAIARMHRALTEYVIIGIRTNLGFHLALTDNAAFRKGEYDTGFIGAHQDEVLSPADVGEASAPMALGGAIARAMEEEKGAMSNGSGPIETGRGRLSAWRLSGLPRPR
jgi:acetyl-CoA carboxylase biotin carboxylase subunit